MIDFNTSMDMLSCPHMESEVSDKVLELGDLKEMLGYEKYCTSALDIIGGVLNFDTYPEAMNFTLSIPVKTNFAGMCSFPKYSTLLQQVNQETKSDDMIVPMTDIEILDDIHNLRVDYILYYLNSFIEVEYCVCFFDSLIKTYGWNDNILFNLNKLRKDVPSILSLEALCKAYYECDFHYYDFADTFLFKQLYETWEGPYNFGVTWNGVEQYISSLLWNDNSIIHKGDIGDLLKALQTKNFMGYSPVEWKCLKKYLNWCDDMPCPEVIEDYLFGTIPYFNSFRDFEDFTDIIKAIYKYLGDISKRNMLRLFMIMPNISVPLYRIFSIDKTVDVQLFAQYFKYKLEDNFINLMNYGTELRFVIEEYLNAPTQGKLSFVPFVVMNIFNDDILRYHYLTADISEEEWCDEKYTSSYHRLDLRTYECSDERYELLRKYFNSKLVYQYGLQPVD